MESTEKESIETALHVLILKVIVAKNKQQSKQSVAQPDLVKLSRGSSLHESASLFWF